MENEKLLVISRNGNDLIFQCLVLLSHEHRNSESFMPITALISLLSFPLMQFTFHSQIKPLTPSSGNSLGGGSPASNAAAAAAAAVAAAATSAAAAGGAGSSAVGASAGAMPQMVLTSGQVVQGVQGAQLLIPTSQGEQTNQAEHFGGLFMEVLSGRSCPNTLSP